MRFSTTFFVLAHLAVASFAATVADVEADLNSISTQVTALDKAVTAFPNTGGSLLAALAIHTDAVNLGSAIDKGTTDTKAVPLPISETDGQTILNLVSSFEPTIEHALSQIIAKKPAFQALPIGGIPALVKQDLSNLSASTNALETALIASAPADLVAAATTLKNNINAAFAQAIAAYA